MHQMQTIEQQAQEWTMTVVEARTSRADAGERGGARHEAGDAGELAHAVVLGYNRVGACAMDKRSPAPPPASSGGAR